MCHHQPSRCFCGATLILKTARCAAAKPDHPCAFPDPVTILIANVEEDCYRPCCANADRDPTLQSDEEPILSPQSDEERVLPCQPDEGPSRSNASPATTAATLTAIRASLDILQAALFMAQEDGLVGRRAATLYPVESRSSDAHAGILRALHDAQRSATAVFREGVGYRVSQCQDGGQAGRGGRVGEEWEEPEVLYRLNMQARLAPERPISQVVEVNKGITAEAQAEIDAMNAARAARWSVRPQGAEFREEFNPRRDYGWSARRPRCS
ncbi:hypothetical protein W97_08673 [Coniosporium apollinis CBS 100218]|uniref:Mediator of RNA polymerase II transcription subunit 11 n=1 Tax=Coniosporium apollinis (strain CBS 100218) TaxID=1168221 RepID=R7Z5M9_CONA1|nr:uncharacterized protein W97_08673 [Coniosporium apollinis CBS 100218]EON69413.1 hypothetical protein W97_08673 [Coniosporium apollinis CBS 100218]